MKRMITYMTGLTLFCILSTNLKTAQEIRSLKPAVVRTIKQLKKHHDTEVAYEAKVYYNALETTGITPFALERADLNLLGISDPTSTEIGSKKASENIEGDVDFEPKSTLIKSYVRWTHPLMTVKKIALASTLLLPSTFFGLTKMGIFSKPSKILITMGAMVPLFIYQIATFWYNKKEKEVLKLYPSRISLPAGNVAGHTATMYYLNLHKNKSVLLLPKISVILQLRYGNNLYKKETTPGHNTSNHEIEYHSHKDKIKMP